MEHSEKRTTTRISFLLTGVASIATEDQVGYRMVDVTATDVSAEGAYLLTDTPVAVGTTVRLLLQSAPELKNSTLMFQAVGAVIRVDKDLPNQKCGIALKFEEVPTFRPA